MSYARILLLEDNPIDRQLLEETLRGDGLAFDLSHVQTKEEFLTALKQGHYDLIISDFALPGYSGMAALAETKHLQPDTPFIFVSGTIGEDQAVESLKLGATDYIIKDRINRLGQAAQRALRESREKAERKRLEEQLHQAQKMEAIGQLAGGIAHDFNNLLLVILGNTELVLSNQTQIQESNHQRLKEVRSAAERAAGLTRQLLAFGRKQVVQSQPLDLNNVLTNLTRMLNRIIGENIQVQCSYAKHLPLIQADLVMMEQVFINLIVNARDAMPQGGSLIITTESVQLDKTRITAHSECSPGCFVCTSISDTGMGIAPENLDRIFEPFFTTKEVGRGTGLGLSVVFGIIKQHKGWVEVVSEPGTGTTFKVFLPASSSPAPEAQAVVKNESALRFGREKILLVEDDSSVRTLARQILTRAGHHVWEASHGAEALEIWKLNAQEIDLLLSDVVMPGAPNGIELAKKLKAENPELKVILMSGYSPERAGTSQCHDYFLQKPYSVDALTSTVRNCFGNGRSAIQNDSKPLPSTLEKTATLQ